MVQRLVRRYTPAQTDPARPTRKPPGHPGRFLELVRPQSARTRREFNSQNYPGHAYYGFRVVLPEAGWKKVGYQL